MSCQLWRPQDQISYFVTWYKNKHITNAKNFNSLIKKTYLDNTF